MACWFPNIWSGRITSRALTWCLSTVSLTKGKVPIITSVRTDRMVVVFTGLTWVGSGKFS